MRILRGKDAWAAVASLETRNAEGAIFREAVAPIIREIKLRGDDGVRDGLSKLYGVDLPPEEFRVAAGLLEDSLAKIGRNEREALEAAIERIETFHRMEMPGDVILREEIGEYGIRWLPISRVGIHIPEFEDVPYVSTLLFTAIPARVAGVEEVAVFTPPLPGGRVHPILLAACAMLGVDEVYRVGGPPAVGAMAYGTAAIQAVDKIFGSGDNYFMAAKQMVAQDVAIDGPSGPSEHVVLADPSADPGEVAMELVSQAEHDVDSFVALITTSEEFAEIALERAFRIAEDLPRGEVARVAMDSRGVALVFDSVGEAVEAVNALAPERVALLGSEVEGLHGEIKTAGAVFVGARTPSSVGDYALGVNQLLPTSGFSRSYGVLTTRDFMRAVAFARLNGRPAPELAELVKTLAALEGLPGHARSAERLAG